MRKQIVGYLLLSLAVTVESGEIKLSKEAEGLAVFKQEDFNMQCWQEGKKIFEEQGYGAISSAGDFSKPRLVFEQSGLGGEPDDKQRVMIVTLGRSLCMIKSI